jgi:hypothetical protein
VRHTAAVISRTSGALLLCECKRASPSSCLGRLLVVEGERLERRSERSRDRDGSGSARVVDSGHFRLSSVARGAEVSGIDAAKGMIEIAGRRVPGRICVSAHRRDRASAVA